MSNYVRYFSGPVYIPTVSGVTLAFGRSLGTTPKTQAHVALARWAPPAGENCVRYFSGPVYVPTYCLVTVSGVTLVLGGR